MKQYLIACGSSIFVHILHVLMTQNIILSSGYINGEPWIGYEILMHYSSQHINDVPSNTNSSLLSPLEAASAKLYVSVTTGLTTLSAILMVILFKFIYLYKILATITFEWYFCEVGIKNFTGKNDML